MSFAIHLISFGPRLIIEAPLFIFNFLSLMTNSQCLKHLETMSEACSKLLYIDLLILKRQHSFWTYWIWQYGLWSFQAKLERFLHKNQHTQRKLLNFENWVNGEVSKSAKIWLSKSIFYVKNYLNLSKFFFHWRITI